jgi:hypothetical protein
MNWCNTNKSKITKINSNIRFKLLKQQFVEIYKTGNILEAVKYARENFKDISNPHDIEEIMILLAIKPNNTVSLPKVMVYFANVSTYYQKIDGLT